MCACSGESVKLSCAPIYSPSIMPLSSNRPAVTKKAAETRGMAPLPNRCRHSRSMARAFRGADLTVHRPENVLEGGREGGIDLLQGSIHAEVGEAGDPLAAHAAR